MAGRSALLAGLSCLSIMFAVPAALAVPPARSLDAALQRTLQKERTAWRTPLDGPLESGFGYRWGQLHAGLDIAVLGDDRVRAALPGIVTAVGWLPHYEGYGLVVKVRHRSGLASMYAHLAAALVRRGAVVRGGQLIGRAGCSGSCTGPHLHFEVHERGRPVDPLRYLGDAIRSLH